MPELPEVETIRRYLEKKIINKKIKKFTVLEKKQFVGNIDDIFNTKIIQLTRKGKVISLKLSNNLFLNIHLKMTGELLYAEDGKNAVFVNEIPRSNTNRLPNKHTRIIFEFSDGSILFFNDLRKFGWIKESQKIETNHSIDILSKNFKYEFLKKIITAAKKPIKLLLMDQDKMAGLGNIYVNDSLWEAKIHPQRTANSLKENEIKNLFTGIKKIIDEAIKLKGSSASDEMYVLPDSTKGIYQYYMKVYHKKGKPCLRDKNPIQKITLGGRGTFFCPKCQK